MNTTFNVTISKAFQAFLSTYSAPLDGFSEVEAFYRDVHDCMHILVSAQKGAYLILVETQVVRISLPTWAIDYIEMYAQPFERLHDPEDEYWESDDQIAERLWNEFLSLDRGRDEDVVWVGDDRDNGEDEEAYGDNDEDMWSVAYEDEPRGGIFPKWPLPPKPLVAEENEMHTLHFSHLSLPEIEVLLQAGATITSDGPDKPGEGFYEVVVSPWKLQQMGVTIEAVGVCNPCFNWSALRGIHNAHIDEQITLAANVRYREFQEEQQRMRQYWYDIAPNSNCED
jgi:hypothetical protein